MTTPTQFVIPKEVRLRKLFYWDLRSLLRRDDKLHVGMTTGWGMTNWVERVRLRNLFYWELRSLLRRDDKLHVGLTTGWGMTTWWVKNK